MGYSTIIIDLEELRDIKSGLAFVLDELNNIERISDTIQGYLGDPDCDLKGAVDDFQSSWDDNRGDLIDSAQKMLDGVTKVIDDWDKWEQGNAQAFQEGGN